MLKDLFKNSGCPRGAAGKLILSMMNMGHRGLHDWALSLAEIAPRAKALDIGCGGGSAMALLLRRCREGRVCGIDVSECGLECSARRNAKAIAAGRCEVRAGSAEAIPYTRRDISTLRRLLKRFTSGATSTALSPKSCAC